MSDLFTKVQETKAALEEAPLSTADAIEAFRIQYLGANGQVKALMGEMRQIPNEQKREFGQAVNALKQAAELRFQEAKAALEAEQENLRHRP